MSNPYSSQQVGAEDEKKGESQEHTVDIEVSDSDDEEVTVSLEGQDDLVTQASSLQAKLDEALALADERQEQMQRAQAEAQNTIKRSKRDVEQARKFALEKFSVELLSVADNLERALESANQGGEAVKSLVEGVELTQKGLIDIFGRFDIEQLDPVSEPFDPQFHEAMSMQESAQVEPGTVLHVFQKGYRLNGRLIRPARVVVSKAAASNVDEKA